MQSPNLAPNLAPKPGPKRTELVLETVLFSSRWLLTFFYLGLAIALVALVVKAGQHVAHLIGHLVEASEATIILDVLGLIDLSLTGSLVVLVIFSGYENFVMRIDPTEHADWPSWMTTIDFAGLKLKLISSIVAISAIHLLGGFMEIDSRSDRSLMWSTGIVLTFTVCALLMALTERFNGHAPADHSAPETSTEH